MSANPQYLRRSPLAIEPDTPELRSRFEFRLGGPVARQSPSLQFSDHSDEYLEWDAGDGESAMDRWSRAGGRTPRAQQGWSGFEEPIHDEPVDEAPAPVAKSSSGTRRRGGAHRLPAPPAALKGRVAVVAVAAGAVVAAGHSAVAGTDRTDHSPSTSELDSNLLALGTVTPVAAVANTDAPQVLNVTHVEPKTEYNAILATGKKFAKDRAALEAALRRPLFALPTRGNFTSGYGTRWGVMHQGIDIAAPIGTPIYAAADGVVLEAGPAAGFGMWVRVQHADGTVTIYGHVNTTTVSAGQKVMAGDKIATVGNRGYSTGPHLHFEVWQAGTNKVDPMTWLANRGIRLGPQRD